MTTGIASMKTLAKLADLIFNTVARRPGIYAELLAGAYIFAVLPPAEAEAAFASKAVQEVRGASHCIGASWRLKALRRTVTS